jgi:hypothetical protein
MAYHIEVVKTILKKNKMDPTRYLRDIEEDSVDRVTLFTLWFCKYGLSATETKIVLDDIDKHEGMKNLYGDGI